MKLRDRWKLLALLGTGTLGLGSAAYGYAVEAEWLEITRYDTPLPGLSPGFEGYKIVQISDLHYDRWTKPDYMEEVARSVNDESPDLIVITGDFVTREVEKFAVRHLPGFLRRLSARDGILGILGNHDYFQAASWVSAQLAEAGIRELANAVYPIRRGDAVLTFAGVDDVLAKEHDLNQVLELLPEENGPVIFLCHEPDFAPQAAETGRFALQLSGHSHGGQICAPLFGAIRPMLPVMGRRYVSGWYGVSGMKLYVNRGIGTVAMPIRFNCRPEMTVFTLQAR